MFYQAWDAPIIVDSFKFAVRFSKKVIHLRREGNKAIFTNFAVKRLRKIKMTEERFLDFNKNNEF